MFPLDAAETVPEGALIQRWDYITLNEGIPRPSELLPLRSVSDDLADAVVEFLDLKAGQDALAAIRLELHKEQPDPCVAEFWRDVNRDPPEGVSGFAEFVNKKPVLEEKGRPEAAMKRNERLGRDGRSPSLEEGQAVFWRYSGGIFNALMHFSLAGELVPSVCAGVRRSLTSLSQAASRVRICRPQ